MEYIISCALWIIGGIAFFILALTLIVVMFIVPFPRYEPFGKWVCRTLLRVVKIRVRTEGMEQIQKDRTYLFMANHVNIFDILVFGGSIPNTFRGVELESHFSWPLYGTMITRMGNIPISQKNPFEAMKSLERTRRIMQRGVSIALLPEGHRTPDGNLGRFARAPFKFALNTSVDIVPMALIDSYKIKRKGSWLIRPGTITLRVGAPITFSSVKDMDTGALRDLVREKIIALIERQ